MYLGQSESMRCWMFHRLADGKAGRIYHGYIHISYTNTSASGALIYVEYVCYIEWNGMEGEFRKCEL